MDEKKPGSKPRSTWQPPSLADMQALLPQYQFLSLIGRGGMGAVYKATQISLKRPVAVKVLPGNLMDDVEANFAARFRQEALTMAKLSHPGIVNVFETGEIGGLLYIVMEFIDGTDVAKMIHRQGKLAPQRAANLLRQVCDALHYAHQRGVIHRDIKPANLIVTPEGRVKIADFGLAKHSDEALGGLTKTDFTIGTPEFLAPEALILNTLLDAQADLYSLGVTLYQMLTGEIPRGLWKMPSVKAGVDARFDAIIDKAMQPERQARYQSSAELCRDLERIEREPRSAEHGSAEGEQRASEPSNARRSVSAPRSKSPVLRRLIVGAAVVLLFLVAALVILWPRLPKKDAARPVATVRDAARWLVQENAQFRVISEDREFEVKTERDIPAGDFQIVYLWFDRWASSPPLPPPPEEEFEVMRAVKTLRYAFLRMPGLSDAPFAFLAGNPDLKDLTIAGSKNVTDEVLVPLAGLKKLQSFAITHAPRLTGSDFAKSAWLASVQEVDFLYATLDDDAIRVLATCPRLRQLKVEGTAITRDGLRDLAPVRTLTELSLGYCAKLSEQDLVELLPEFGRLKKLQLSYTAFGNEAAGAVVNLTNLTELILFGTKMSDEGLTKLSVPSRLKLLNLVGTRVTADGIAAFEQAHPQCKIER